MPKAANEPELAGKRIVIYGINYAPELAGVGRYTGDIGQYLSRQGADVTVITAPPHYPGWRLQAPYKPGRYASEVRDGARVIRCPLILREAMGGIWRLLAPLSFAMSSLPVALWQIFTRRPDVILTVMPTLFSAPAALLAGKLVRARTVLHVQDLEVDAAFAVGHLGSRRVWQKIAFAIEGFILRRFDMIITISNRMAERIVGKGVPADRLTLIRNWVDVSHIRPLAGPSPYRAELGFGDDDFVVLYAGNIGAKQGLDLLIDAARRLKGEPRIHFVVAGEGPLKTDLEQRASDLPAVHFLPFQPYERFSDFLGFADLHVLPQEAGAADLVLPSKLGGMLASGRPVLVTAEQGTELADWLQDAADVIPPGDAARLAEGLAQCAREPEPAGRAASRLALAARLSHTDALAAFAKVLFGGEARTGGEVVARQAGEGVAARVGVGKGR